MRIGWGLMKRYLIPILLVLILASTILGCASHNSQPVKQTTKPSAELITYFAKEELIIGRNSETLEAVNNSMEALSLEEDKPCPDNPSKTQLEAIEPGKPPKPIGMTGMTVEAIKESLSAPRVLEPIIPSGLKQALTSGVATLDWALERLNAELLDHKGLNPPEEATTYHGLMVEILLKEQAINTYFRSNYVSLLTSGSVDVEALDRLKEELTEWERLWPLYVYEMDKLSKKVGK
jgi:hypothetical protein